MAATLVFAGFRLDATSVRLIVDHTITRNMHVMSIRSRCADIEIAGNPSSDNPKTSMTAGNALAQQILTYAPRIKA